MAVNPYSHVAVLLIKWADDLEEVKTRDQVETLESQFRERFHYETKIVELDTARLVQPNIQLSEHLSSFVRVHDGLNNLLIVYYSGFGVLRTDSDFLELSATSRPLDKDVLAPWKVADAVLRRSSIDSDVWTILTTPFAPKLPSPDSRPSLRQTIHQYRIGRKGLISPRRRCYELLSECPEHTSKFSSPRSFNRAVIRSFNILLDEMPNIAFTTEHLHRLILLDPTRHYMQVDSRSQLDAKDWRHILLVAPVDRTVPLGKQVIDTKAVNIEWNSILQRNALLITAAMADDKWGEGLDIESNTLDDGLPRDNQDSPNTVPAEIASALWHDWCFYRLYRMLPGKIGRKRFVKIHDQILMKFFRAKQSEIDDGHFYAKTVRQLQTRSQSTQISNRIYELCNYPIDPNPQPSLIEMLAETRRGKHNEDYPHLIPLSKGRSFQTLWDDLHSLLRPYLSIQDALNSRNVDILRILLTQNFHNAMCSGNIKFLRSILTEHFDIVAVGEFSWIRELDDAGYTREEIADLLYEEASDATWIFFEPEVLIQDPLIPDVEMHIQGCVHQVLDDAHQYSPSRSLLREEDNRITYQVQELCGLAGVAPSSRSREKWNGSISFERQGTVAVVSYAVPDEISICNRVITTLERLCSAASRSQSSGYCCNSFTVLVNNHALVCDPRQIKIYCVQLLDAIHLLKDMKELAFGDRFYQRAYSYDKPTKTALRILSPFDFQIQSSPSNHDSVQLLSIAAQFLSLGFLSYHQGHIGPFQPFFLDTALSGIYLTGVSKRSSWQLELTCAELTCVGDMLASSVLTFSVRQGNGFRVGIPGQNFDLLTTAEHFLDTWGPGNFILPKDHDKLPCAIRIGGGTIYGYGSNGAKFHWTKSMRLHEPQPVCFDPRSEILIGGLVSINTNCQIDEKESWNKSCSAFENLGVHGEFWIHDEKQIGGQAGQYVMLQHNRIKHKIPGKTLKQYYLDQDPETLVCVLNCLWGLQVSFCTGVTRRVPLRLLIADLLPYFSKLFPKERDLWTELQVKYDILNGLHTENVQSWFETLPPQLYKHVLQIITRILLTLQPTGIDQEGKFLLVAWPYDCPPFRCFKIPCDDKMSSWARVLADSEDCATFAYISTNCLETPTITCRGPSPLWHNKTPLLETAIVRHNETPSKPLGPLEHKNAYFFKKLNSLLQVTVDRKSCGSVSLVVSTSSIPERFRQRVYALEMKKNQRSRIRERQKQNEIGSENVFVLTKSEN